MTYALSQASPTGDTIALAAGTYVENVAIDKSVILSGASQASTVILPAISNPNCGGAGGGSLCAGSSNVLLVQANNVEIRNLTIDGDNPALTSSENFGGANLDARNGIITDHVTVTTITGLNVHDVTVKNIYLRGIYASTQNGTFSFTHDTVRNVQASNASICMFSFTSSGTMAFNSASDCSDALAANWSVGTQFLNNTITSSGSGVHTDNAGGAYAGSAVPDLIAGNRATNLWVGTSYAFWVFAPYNSPVVSNNVVIGAAVGLGAFGSFGGTPLFLDNTVDCGGQSGTVGAWASTTIFQFGSLDLQTNLQGNFIDHCAVGIQGDAETDASVPTTYTLTLAATGNSVLHSTVAGVSLRDPGAYNSPNPANPPGTYNVTLDHNRIVGNAVGLSRTTTSAALTLAAAENWWGCNAGPGGAGALGTCDTVAGTAAVTPWLVMAAPAVVPGTITAPGNATVKTDIQHDSTNALSPPGIPDLTPTAFSATLPGIVVTPANPVTAAGQASATLIATAGGTANACAAVDNEKLCSGINVDQAPAITSADHVTFVLGVPSTFTVTTTGAPAPTLGVIGALPNGVTFVDNGDGTATLAGTPAFGTGGTYPLTITASNGVGSNATQPFTLTVDTGFFFSLEPCRVFDSRSPSNPLTSDVNRIQQVTGVCGVPASATAVSVNVTVVTPSSGGILRLFAGDQSTPGTSVLSFNMSLTRANNALVQLALDGSGTVAIRPELFSAGSVDVVLDVNGYFN